MFCFICCFKQKTAYEMRISDWSSDVCSSDLDNGDANDTNATIAEILKLRQQRAELLGFPTHAHYRMADTMAKTPEAAMGLMMKVWPAAVARVKEEVADMQAIADAEAKANKTPKITIEPWDYRFYAEQVRKAKYDLDESEVKPYIQLDKLVDGMFWSAGQLYDLGFRENTGTIAVFALKVRIFEEIERAWCREGVCKYV